jgi:hypothetical protein
MKLSHLPFNFFENIILSIILPMSLEITLEEYFLRISLNPLNDEKLIFRSPVSMSRNLEDQMRLSLRAILSKEMNRGGDKHRVIASFVSDDNGFPLTGLKRDTGSITEMEADEFEHLCAIIPQLWESAQSSSQGLSFIESEEEEINHLTIGFRRKGDVKPHLEMVLTRLEDIFLSSVYYTKK